ncbi:MAG: beta-lactamase family protein [Phycisphaerales bacterium]|nr:MAG: beta-lactamase family protein [Phycisphaerales bacterium]
MMKFKTSSLALLVMLIGMVANARTAALAAKPSQQESPLRLSEQVEGIVADLESYVPEYMREQDIPGVGIALVWDGDVVWTEGFGIANVLTRQPITPETLFEVASNSKVVTAYIALRLVDQGLLSLDEPLNAYLPEPWLRPSEYRDAITLRHVLSHSSGLGHNTTSRHNLFAPGRGYSYSAIGFQYLQAVIEQTTGESLEQLAQEMVYVPLGMSSSSFINRAEFTSRTANGHLHAILPALLFSVCYVISLIVVGLIGLVILRIWTGQWRSTRRMVIGTFTVAFVLSLLPAFVLFGISGLLEFAWLIAFCGLILTIVFALTFLVGRAGIVRISSKRPRQQIALTIVWSVLILVGLVLVTCRLTNLPVPKWTGVKAEAAGSMRATAGDMATFLIELSKPRHLSKDRATELQTAQIRLNSDLSWGLGPGIQHSRQGDALWQWGQHIDFQSVMIIYPEHGFGVAVCTNNDLLNPEVAVEIAHRALGGKIEPIRRAIHLEFNYSEGN